MLDAFKALAYRAPTAVGVDGHGNLQYWVRVIVNTRTNIVTSAYPASRPFRP